MGIGIGRCGSGPVGEEIASDGFGIDDEIPLAKTDGDFTVSEILLPQDVLVPEEVAGECVRYAHVHAGKVPQLPFVGAAW